MEIAHINMSMIASMLILAIGAFMKSWKPYLGRYAISSEGEVISCYYRSKGNEPRLQLLKPWKDKNGYFVYRLGDERNTYIHQLVARLFLGDSLGRVIDHIDGNVTNNKISNLRYCSRSNNQSNQKIRKDNSTGYKGVYFMKRANLTKRYQAYINIHGKRHALGCFATAEEAAQAYNKAARELHGDFARLNQCLA